MDIFTGALSFVCPRVETPLLLTVSALVGLTEVKMLICKPGTHYSGVG